MNTQINNLHTALTSILTSVKKANTEELDKEGKLISLPKYIPVPNTQIVGERLPMWQVRFEILRTDAPVDLCLEINGDIILGVEDEEGNVINLSRYNNNVLGVSRRHLQISPDRNDLLMIDLNSTNGTRKNGRCIQPNTPYRICDGDILELGDLIMVANIEKMPNAPIKDREDDRYIVNTLTHLSTLVTSNLDLEAVLQRIVDTAIDLCQAEEVALFLLDKKSNELYLKLERGIGADKTEFMRIPVEKELPILKVLQTGESLRCAGTLSHKYEVVTGYFVNAAIYVPITVGEDSMGILVAMQQSRERDFTRGHEHTLSAIGKYASIAIQNSQKSEATNEKLQSKIDELSIYNAISRELSKTNNLTGIYNVLRNQIREHWNVENIGLWLMDQASNNLVPFPKPSFHKTYAMGQEMIGNVASRAEPILATNIKLFSEPTKALQPTLQLLARSAACVPIMENSKVLGVLAAFSTRENEFSERAISLLQTLAHTASAAIRNAWLFEQVDKQRATILAAVNMLPHPMLIVDQDEKVIVSNKAADTLLRELYLSTNGKEDAQNGAGLPLTILMDGLAESKWHTKEIRVGEKIYIATLEYASMIGTVILMQDVTDPVTGASNYRNFHDLAEQAFHQARRYSTPLTALVIGSENVRKVIDEQGYTIANQILKGLASQLRNFLRTPDILGRYREYEFMVLLPETNLENARIVAERITKSMSKKSDNTGNYKLVSRLKVCVTALDFEKDTSIDVFMEKAYCAFLSAKSNRRQINVHKNI